MGIPHGIRWFNGRWSMGAALPKGRRFDDAVQGDAIGASAQAQADAMEKVVVFEWLKWQATENGGFNHDVSMFLR